MPKVWPDEILPAKVRFWVRMYTRSRRALREKEEESPVEPFLRRGEAVVGRLAVLLLEVQKTTGILYVASGLQKSCQSMEACKLELRALLVSKPHSALLAFPRYSACIKALVQTRNMHWVIAVGI